jgi:AP-2 complex subunit alpha
MSVPHVTNTMKCVGSYVISEFSDYLVKSGKEPQKLFDAINKHFQTANNKSRSMMLNAFAKLGVKYESLKEQVQMIFMMCSEHWDPDVQQRGV